MSSVEETIGHVDTGGEETRAGEAILDVLNDASELEKRLKLRIEEKQVALARASTRHFLEYTQKDSATGLKIKCSHIHQSWCEHVDTYWPTKSYIGVLAPWGYGKSSFLIGLILKLIGQNPNVRIGIISNSDVNASKRLAVVGAQIRENEDYQRVCPHIKPDLKKAWNEHRLVVQRTTTAVEGTLEAYGVDSTGIGSRFDVMIFDDPIDTKDAESEAVRKSRIVRISDTWMSRIEPHGKAFWIATRWHKHDANHTQLQDENWKFIVQAVTDDFKNIIEPPVEYRHYPSVVRRTEPRLLEHWVEKWSEEELKIKAARLGIRSFNRGYRQRPYSDEDTLFREDAILGACKWKVTRNAAIPEDWPKYLGADLAGDQRPGTVIVVIARDPKTGKKKLAEVVRGNWGWSSRTADLIVKLFKEHNCRLGYVENNSAQETMLELIRTKHGIDIPLKGYTTGKQKADPFEGLPGLAVQFENGAWEFPLAHVASEEGYLASSEVAEIVLIRELMEFPHGATSDCVMALWFADAAASKGRGLGVPGVYTGGSGRGNTFANKELIYGHGYGKREFGT